MLYNNGGQNIIFLVIFVYVMSEQNNDSPNSLDKPKQISGRSSHVSVTTHKLKKRFPGLLYKDGILSNVEPGWYNLLFNLCYSIESNLTNITKTTDDEFGQGDNAPKVHFRSINISSGGLDLNLSTNQLNDLLQEFEDMSQTICANCTAQRSDHTSIYCDECLELIDDESQSN